MNTKKPSFVKRTCAYLIDLIIVSFIAGIISLIFVNSDNYNNRTREILDLTRKYTAGEVTREEYIEQSDTLNYYMTKDSVEVSIINCSVALLYYVILCYYCNGITLGKYLLKMRIVSASDKKLNIGNYLIRALFVNLILSNLINIILVSVLSKEGFTSIYSKLSGALTIFLMATMLFIMYREDGRGLHDLMAKTMIISTKEDKNNETKEDKEIVTEAKVLEEKEVASKKKKNSKKKEVKNK